MLDLKGYGPALAEGAVVTIELAFLSLALAVTLGLLGASAKLSGNRVLTGIGGLCATLDEGLASQTARRFLEALTVPLAMVISMNCCA